MKKAPQPATLLQLEVFLDRAVEAVLPPGADSLRGTIFAPSVTTLEELLWIDHPTCPMAPFQTTERLRGTADERAAMLLGWLRRMPGYAWLRDAGPVKRAEASFKIANKKRLPATFTDAAAELRFWRIAIRAAKLSLSPRKPAANREVRDQGLGAVKTLLNAAKKTTLLSDALGESGERMLLDKLRQLETYTKSVTRIARSDAATEQFVAAVTDDFFASFGDSIPRVVGDLAGLVTTANAESRERYAKAARRAKSLEKSDR